MDTLKPLVKVVWHDAQDLEGTWNQEDEVKTFSEEVCEIVSVGFVYSRGPKYLILAADCHEEEGTFSRTTKIPTGCIVSITPLVESPIEG